MSKSSMQMKMANYSGYHSKKITSTIQPANLPKDQKFQLIIDILQDKICLFVTKDEKNYEAIETLLTEQDIVNLVNQNPIVQFNEASLTLAYEGFLIRKYLYINYFRFPKVELRQVKQFTDTQQFKKIQQSPQPKESVVQAKATQLAMPLEEMYEQLKSHYNEEVNSYEQIMIGRKKKTLEEQVEVQAKIEEMDKLKKDQKEYEVVKTLTVKAEFLGKEAANYDKFIQEITIYKANSNKITQIEYLKALYLMQQIEKIYQDFSLKRESLEKNLQFLLDDLRRHKIRKNQKEYEETEKRVTAIAKDFQQLIEENMFFKSEAPKIKEKFLEGDESQIYEQKLVALQSNAEKSIEEAATMGQQLQEKQKEFNEYRKKFDEIKEQNEQMAKSNEELKKQVEKVSEELNDNLEWKKKYLEITILMEELQAQHDTTLRQLEAGIFLKEKEMKFYKNQVYEKYQIIQELEKQGNAKFQDQRVVSLSTEVEKLKKEKELEAQKSEEIEIQLDIQKDKIAELEIKIQYYDQQLSSYKQNESQLRQEQIANQQSQNELKFAHNEISVKEQKIANLKQEMQEKESELTEFKAKNQKFFEEYLKLKNEIEILKVDKERNGIEQVNRKLEGQVNNQY